MYCVRTYVHVECTSPSSHGGVAEECSCTSAVSHTEEGSGTTTVSEYNASSCCRTPLAVVNRKRNAALTCSSTEIKKLKTRDSHAVQVNSSSPKCTRVAKCDMDCPVFTPREARTSSCSKVDSASKCRLVIDAPIVRSSHQTKLDSFLKNDVEGETYNLCIVEYVWEGVPDTRSTFTFE